MRGIVRVTIERELGLPAHQHCPQAMVVRHVEHAGDIRAVVSFLVMERFPSRRIRVLRPMVAARPHHAASGHHGRVIGKRDGHVVIIARVVRPSPFGLKTLEVRQLVPFDHRLEVHGAESVDADLDEELAGLGRRGLRKEQAGQHQAGDETSPGNCRDGVGKHGRLLGGIAGKAKAGWQASRRIAAQLRAT